METLDYDHNIHTTPNAGDASLLVRFFIDAMKDDVASKAAGRPIFKDVEWIDIRIPGNRDNIVIRPVRPRDLERFPAHYAAFKKRIEGTEASVGTPLAAWPWHGMTRARVEELKHFNVRTVEQLAAIPDSIGTKLMGFHAMRDAARAYLDTAKANAPLLKLHALLEQATQKIEEQGREIARLTAIVGKTPVDTTVDVAAPLRKQIAEVEALPPADPSAPQPPRRPKKAVRRKR